MSDNGMVRQMEEIVDAATASLIDQWKAIVGDVGNRQVFQEFVPERTQARNMGFAWNDPQTWQGIVQEHGAEQAIKHFERGLKLREKYPEEFEFGLEAAGAQTPEMPQMEMPMEGGEMNG